MTLLEAIEVNKNLLREPTIRLPQKNIDGIQLGNEALEFLELLRSKAQIQPYPLLKSETID